MARVIISRALYSASSRACSSMLPHALRGFGTYLLFNAAKQEFFCLLFGELGNALQLADLPAF